MNETQTLIVGANGQLGIALKRKYPKAKTVDINELDITNKKSIESYEWSDVDTILNAAAYTNVDGAETAEGRVSAWLANAYAPALLSRVAREHDLTLIHISTDYVFDGTNSPHSEYEPFSPLSVYGASKAAGDIAIALAPKHYILRTSWVIGEGKNFVRTMLELGKKGINPSVVSDQIGRLTFTSELVRAISHLLSSNCQYGTYNISNDGEPVSWAEITRQIFKSSGLNNSVTDITTAEYYKGKSGIAPRPLHSELNLDKIKGVGFIPKDWNENLREYITKESA